MKKLIIAAGALFNVFVAVSLSFSGQISAGLKHVSDLGNAYKVLQTAQFPESDFTFDKLKGYDIITLKDGDFLAELGKPMLPSKEVKIALPTGMVVKNVQVVKTTQEELSGEYNIFPAQPPRRTDLSDRDTDLVEPDKETYFSSHPYPLKLVGFVHQTDLAGQGIAVIQIYPLQYVPAERRLILYTSITIEIVGVGGYRCGDYLSPNISEKGRETYEQMIRDMVQNPEDVQLNTGVKMSASMVPPGGPFAHIIITSSSYASYFQPLVDWHTKKGVKDTVITTSWIYSNYSGSTNQQKIRNFIIDANSSWGTTYFLLGGENETVPFEYRYYYDETTPSDQYYSDFDDDWTHEVFVGRVSVGSSSEVTTFVNKILEYEKNPPRTNYPLDVLLIGMDLDSSTHAEYLKENIDAYIPSQFNVKKVYDSHGGNHRDSVLYYLNDGQNLVNHADHANTTELCTGYFNHNWRIYDSDVDALTNNDQMSIVVSLGCHPNEMDYNDCIAEHFVIYNPDQGGVAFTGNTRSGWYYISDPYGLSNALDKEWWVGLFSRNKYNLGQTIVDSKHHFPISNPDIDVKRHCAWTFNLLGEPEMPIWTDEPGNLAVIHPSTLPIGTSSFPVHVEDSTTHTPVNQAYVCLWKANEIYLTGYTNASGDVTLYPSPTTMGNVDVTVTAHNFLPYEGTAVVENTGPIWYVSTSGDDLTGKGDSLHPFATIQKGINKADSGDTVLVAPGTYRQNINFRGKPIVVASYLIRNGDTSNVGQTTIDGGQPSHPDTGSAVMFISGEDSTSKIIGFTITNGSGTVVPSTKDAKDTLCRAGGGILCYNGSSPTISNNIIVSDTAAWGGGIGCETFCAPAMSDDRSYSTLKEVSVCAKSCPDHNRGVTWRYANYFSVTSRHGVASPDST
jgi:hypothetical protein